MPVKGWGFGCRTRAPLMVIRSKRGGLVTRVPRSEDFSTCPVSRTTWEERRLLEYDDGLRAQ
ncbi:hypothetical protein HID58_039546 [Brassica napus]|uniref:Uncharacterized protein n=1 Tax=Brassica napus TaxID=3708 RepID=A0ABQ8BSB9_BRANA|nr:hypothetical protein HID58_039546 [Brassica napus]